MSADEPRDAKALRQQVRARYAQAAAAASNETAVACCGEASSPPGFGAPLYAQTDTAAVPAAAMVASLGCGNPTVVADLREGEVVLDLGSGGGLDVLLSAKQVGPTGRAYGLDMTAEMLALARRNAATAGIGNAEFLEGHIEAIPLPAASVDVVISNCVINLSADKAAVFAEIFRVLKPGGRVAISDVVAEDRLTRAQRESTGQWAGCTAGVLSRSEYETALKAAGFGDSAVTFTHQVGDGLHGALVTATKPDSRGHRPGA
ncbi:MAG: arsenite methyltransferase [Actinomycetota bacterium]|nr:arsenite methyltransferase [Actinomycetota bacterium]